MITKNNIERLEKIIAYYAMIDFRRANPKLKINRKTGLPEYNPYTLSPLTNEARKIKAIALKQNITDAEENQVKAYLLRKKMIENL